ncbi:circadian clock protein LdpA [Nodosilinea sp. PGN35]|uniref:circadian clock protein LdpA n=1 Tax=Nodosilinea sp. PGN35 TaxID=3020489 RepID=UPI0023B26C62|nr:LdpA C-terminal domain-containing domain [Nodosilinea sp. TSF1-S3]MDF0369259.1 LdpA C-terminal domain-containing domain [Nodosilinea sp. TSF1-S3]
MDIDIAPGSTPRSQYLDSPLPFPHRSLQMGRWVKLICGASYQDMPTVQRLVMLYALAGVDCIDVAADGAVVAAARRGLADAVQLSKCLGAGEGLPSQHRSHLIPGQPWLMVSLNDSEDPHFRKAHFDAAHCPPACDRPCESICPTAAIQFQAPIQAPIQGRVVTDLCYGCGRCIAVCPVSQIEAQSYLASPEAFPTEQLAHIDAVEIHTQTGHQAQFNHLWQRLQPWRPYLKLVSISCPDHDQVVPYLWDLYHLMAPLEVPLIWQTDGRPMSGDLGKGTTHAAIRLAQKILDAGPPGYVQPAGGTNGYTVDKLLNLGLVNPALPTSQPDADSPDAGPSPQSAGVTNPDAALVPKTIAGIAYGSYGRSQVMPLLDALDQELQPWLGNGSPDQSTSGQSAPLPPRSGLSNSTVAPWQRLDSSALGQGLALARQLVGPLKSHRHFLPTRYG